MSKKKKGGQKAGPGARPAPAFAVGSKVRVRPGVKDPDAPDMPIGLWCGTVEDRDLTADPCGYQVRWDRRTVDQMHPVFVKRCRRDDLEVEVMWLEETDLEPDGGELLPVEQPSAIATRPLNPEDQDDRVRAVFGLTSDDPLPEVEGAALADYHEFLSARLTFPFEAAVEEETGPREYRERHVTVQRLAPLAECEEDGLLGVVRDGEQEDVLPLYWLEGTGNTEQRRLVGDYAFWFVRQTGRRDVLRLREGLFDAGGEGQDPDPPALGRLLNKCALAGAAYGATVGAITAALEEAKLGTAVAGGLLALLLGLAGRRYGAIVGAVNRVRHGPLIGMLMGALAGGLLGALAGALAVAYVGSIAGSIVGVILAGTFAPAARRPRAKFWGGVAGAALGGIGLAFHHDHQFAAIGLAAGAAVGAVGSALLTFVVILFLAAFSSGREA